MLDIRNHNLAEVTHADDFIVRDKLVSLLLAQLSENKRSMSSSLICSIRKALRSTLSPRPIMWRWGWL